MTLFQHTLGQLLRGEKTETSRLSLPHADGEHIVNREMIQWPSGVKSVMRGTAQGWRIKWQVGQQYAIQPARGVKSIGKYKLLDVWQQDVRTLTPQQVTAEGFSNLSGFLVVWCAMHDKTQNPVVLGTNDEPLDDLWHKAFMAQHPYPERYQAWRMKIEVQYETVDWDAPAVKWLQISPYADLKQRLTQQEWHEQYLGKWMPSE